MLTKHRRGEKTAEALESNLTNLEKKIDDLLASFEEAERRKVEEVEEVNAQRLKGNSTAGGGGGDGVNGDAVNSDAKKS